MDINCGDYGYGRPITEGVYAGFVEAIQEAKTAKGRPKIEMTMCFDPPEDNPAAMPEGGLRIDAHLSPMHFSSMDGFIRGFECFKDRVSEWESSGGKLKGLQIEKAANQWAWCRIYHEEFNGQVRAKIEILPIEEEKGT